MQDARRGGCRHHRASRLGRFVAGAVAATLTLALPALGAGPAPTGTTVLVKLDPGASSRERAQVARALGARAGEQLPGGWRVYESTDDLTLAEARRELRATDADRAVAVDQPLRALEVPNDPLFGPVAGGYQWALRNTASWSGGVAGADIDALPGWTAQGDGADVIVAVTDTGIQTGHPDLADRIWTNAGEIPGNGADDDGNGYVDDVSGYDFANDDATVYDPGADESHGTHVAGTIAAARGNGVGVAGVAANARVMPVKFINGESGYTSDAIEGITYAVANGARVINASWGSSSYNAPLCDAIAAASAAGVVLVAAAGNSSADNDGGGTWPANCPGTTLAVAATTHSDGLASFSNYGATTVDLGAPGQWIASTVPDGYGYKSGTSMAAPHVAGVAAALLGERADLTPSAVRQAIRDGGDPVAALSATTVSGRRLSLSGALARIGLAAPPAPAPAPSPAPAPAPVTPAPAATTPGRSATARRPRLRVPRRVRAGRRPVIRVRVARTTRVRIAAHRGRRALGAFGLRARGGVTKKVRVPTRIVRKMRRAGVYTLTARTPGGRPVRARIRVVGARA